jgi:hypothetical protein
MAQEFKIKNGVIVSGSADVEQDITVNGLSKFGNSLNDTHQFTGSIEITGSIMLNGEPLGTGKLDETTFESFTSSYTSDSSSFDSRIDNLETLSGSFTGSFSGSFNGDGTNLFNIPASGVTGLNLTQIADGSVTASVSNTNGLRINSKTEITGSLTVTEGITGSIDYLNIINVPTLVSGSSQINITGTTGYSTFSSSVSSSISDISSSIATTDLNQNNRLNSIENVTGSYATTGSNLFKGTQTHSGSILPSVDNAYDLGSVDYQWRDVYISSGSLYIDGTKVISSTAQELTITTDTGQSIKILEGTTDSIILQTADGDIELKSSADGDILLDPTNGKIMLKGPIEIFNGNKIQSSVGGTPVVFANDIVISGSIDLTGTIEGIDLTDFSSSVNTRIGNLETSTGSLNTFTSSTNNRLNSIETVTGSFVSYSGTTNTRLNNLETSTGSLNTFTSSANNRLNSIESSTGSLNIYTGSNDTIIGTLQVSTNSLNSYTSSNTNNINDIHTSTSSLNSYTSSNNIKISSIETSTSSLNSFTGSVNNRLISIETTTGSLLTVNTTQNNRLDSLETTSGSILTVNTTQNNRLDSIEGKTGSYATTGSNNFIGDQTITGSLYISQNLIVQGSSSLENITASAVSIGTNTIILNADTPAIRYAGISVFDSGSTNVTASLFYDSLTNNWKFQHSDVGTDDASILLYGPLGTGIDNAPTLVGNFLTKVEDNGHGHHLTTSSILDNGSKISLKNNTEITGSLIITSTIVSQGTTLVSGSGQISYTGIINIPSGIVSGSSQITPLLPAGTVSGSSQVTYSGLTGIPSGIVSGSSQITPLLPAGTVSGSSQITYGSLSGIPNGIVSGSSQVLNGTTIHSGSFFNGITVVSGSSQIIFGSISSIPSGLVSGSSQVLNGTTIHSGSFFNGISVVSGSGQISFNGITDKPTLVSGSSQVSFTGLSSIPGGLVSGSSQIDLTATTNYSTGIKTRLNAEGVISGSAQVVLTSGQVTTALGYTPYNSTNPNGYISSITSGNVTTALGYTPYNATNPNGYISSSATSLSLTGNLTVSSGNVTGGGIILADDGDIVDLNDAYCSMRFSSGVRIFSANRGGSAVITLGSNGVVTATTFSGALSGNATTATTAGALTSMNISQFTNNSNYITSSGSISGNAATASRVVNGNSNPASTAFNNTMAPASSSNRVVNFDGNGTTPSVWWTSGTRAYGAIDASDPGLSFWSNNGSAWQQQVAMGHGTFNVLTTLQQGGNQVIHAGNIGSQSVNYANSAGSAPNGSNSNSFYNVTAGDGNGLKFWASDAYKISMGVGSLYQYGPVTDYSIKMQMDAGSAGRGFTWGREGVAPIAGLNGTSGNMQIAGTFTTGGSILPLSNNSVNLGSVSLGWANVYTNDLHLSNMNKPEGNDIDGTKGTWTIQEGLENLYIINNNNGKKFKIILEEV